MESWTTLISTCRKALLDFVYPPFCVVCETALPDDTHYYCYECFADLIPPDPHLRCCHCFAPHEQAPRPCSACVHHPSLNVPQAWVFDRSEAAHELHSRIARIPKLHPAVAGYAYIQMERLAWREFVHVIPLLDPAHVRFLDAQKSLASHLAHLLGGKSYLAFRKQSVGLFQWRLQLSPQVALEGKRLLLFHAGSNLDWVRRAVGLLRCADPRDIRVLSVFEPFV